LGSAFFADGAAYSTKTGTWRKLPTSPLSARWEHAAISTDSGVLIYGGIGTDCGGPCGDGATFDPKTNTWTMLPKPPSALPAVRFPAIARSDSAVILWGGATDGGQSNTGAIFDLTARGWKEMSLPGSARAEGGAYGGASWFAAGKFWSWGGQGASGPLSSGASYDVASSMWKAMATGPVARLFAASAWTGSEELIWGGAQKVDPYYLADGKIYRP
jgi:hypothetical protein